jgi:hypothetical protein
MVGGAAPGVSAELKDPLSPLTSAGGSILCFGRDYSADHLAQIRPSGGKSIKARRRRPPILTISEKGGFSLNIFHETLFRFLAFGFKKAMLMIPINQHLIDPDDRKSLA